MILCSCYAVSERTLRSEIAAGARSIDDLGCRTGAGTECGSCRCELYELLAEAEERANERVSRDDGSAYGRGLEVV